MKILLISSLYTPNVIGGAERVVQSLAEEITQAGHQAIVVSTGFEDGINISWVNGVKAYYVGVLNLYKPFKEGGSPPVLKPLWHALDSSNPLMERRIASILREEQPDLVHTHTFTGFSALCWRAIKGHGVPLVHTLHDYYLLCPKATMFRDSKNCRKRCLRCLPYSLPRRHYSDLVDVVTGVSDFILKRHLEYGFFAKARQREVIYNGFKVEKRMAPSREYKVPIRFGYLGRLDATKGLEGLLSAADKLPGKTWTLSIGGTGPTSYVEHLRATYGAPNISLLGYVDTDAFFDQIDVLVVPSVWHEPSPRVISEAFAHGIPVIGSRRGGMPELIENGSTGLLFEPKRRDDLLYNLRRVTDDPVIIEKMRAACLRRAMGILPRDIAAQYLEVYANVATNA